MSTDTRELAGVNIQPNEAVVRHTDQVMPRFTAGRPEYPAADDLERSGGQYIVDAHIAGVLIIEIRGICRRVTLLLKVFAGLQRTGFLGAFAERNTTGVDQRVLQ